MDGVRALLKDLEVSVSSPSSSGLTSGRTPPPTPEECADAIKAYVTNQLSRSKRLTGKTVCTPELSFFNSSLHEFLASDGDACSKGVLEAVLSSLSAMAKQSKALAQVQAITDPYRTIVTLARKHLEHSSTTLTSLWLLTHITNVDRNDYASALAMGGAMPYLCQVWETHMNHPKIMRLSMALMANLLYRNNSNKHQFVEVGALSLLIDLLLKGSPKPRLFAAAHLCLDRLVFNKDLVDKVLEFPLFEVLSKSVARIAKGPPYSDDTDDAAPLNSVLRTLRNVSKRNERGRELVTTTDVLTDVIALAKGKFKDSKLTVNLARNLVASLQKSKYEALCSTEENKFIRELYDFPKLYRKVEIVERRSVTHTAFPLNSETVVTGDRNRVPGDTVGTAAEEARARLAALDLGDSTDSDTDGSDDDSEGGEVGANVSEWDADPQAGDDNLEHKETQARLAADQDDLLSDSDTNSGTSEIVDDDEEPDYTALTAEEVYHFSPELWDQGDPNVQETLRVYVVPRIPIFSVFGIFFSLIFLPWVLLLCFVLIY